MKYIVCKVVVITESIICLQLILSIASKALRLSLSISDLHVQRLIHVNVGGKPLTPPPPHTHTWYILKHDLEDKILMEAVIDITKEGYLCMFDYCFPIHHFPCRDSVSTQLLSHVPLEDIR